MNEAKLTELSKRIRVAGGLPVFSETLQQVLELIHSDSASMPEVAKAIEQDPSLTGRVLKMANSAFYGLSQQVSSLNLALVLLGVRNLRNLTHGIGFLEILGDGEGPTIYPRPGFREHCVRCGRATTLLAKLHGFSADGEEFVAGLIHDIGQLVLLRAYGDLVEERGSELVGKTGESLMAAEREIFGIDHAEAGAWAAEGWQLPEAIVVSIARHHEVSKPGEPALPSLVQAAEIITHWYEDLDLAAGGQSELPAEWAEHPVLSHPDLEGAELIETLGDSLEVLA